MIPQTPLMGLGRVTYKLVEFTSGCTEHFVLKEREV